MKKIYISLLLFFFLFFGHTVYAQETEHIENFEETVHINTDGSIKVVEKIIYDFGSVERHGIFRDIPTIKTNTEGKQYKMDVKVVSVTDESGSSYKYTQTGNDTIQLKIGDPDSTISGRHAYIITYTVKGALTYFSDHDELYWNITGNGWNVPIHSVTTVILLPDTTPLDQIKVLCYTGGIGSTEQACTQETQGSEVRISSTKLLHQAEGVTAIVGFPKGIVSIVEPTEVKPFSSTLLGKLVIIAAIIALLGWYIFLPIWLAFRWWHRGRDPKVPVGQVQAWFDPPRTKQGRFLTSAETGTLIDENANLQEIASLIVNLAQRGYLKIVEKVKNDFEFVKTKDYTADSDLLAFEKTFLTKIFEKKEILRLKEAELWQDVETIKDSIYNTLVSEKYFPENPQKVRGRYMILTVLSLISFNIPLLLSSAIFGRLMPRKTLDGVEASNIAKSLRNFLTSQERQLEFQAKNQMFFEKLLPFAIAFGVEKIWADRFKDIDITPPAWFVSSQTGVFNSQTFAQSLGASMSSFNTAATPKSSSTGHSSGFSGGSSGGGGGGGGGGSW